MSRDQIRKGSTELIVLALLHESPRHGYGIRKTVSTRSRRSLQLTEGALYTTLAALEEKGFVWSKWVGESKRQRRVYSITEQGQEHLTHLLLEWVEFLETLRACVPQLDIARDLFLRKGGAQ